MKKLLIFLVCIFVLGLGIFFFLKSGKEIPSTLNEIVSPQDKPNPNMSYEFGISFGDSLYRLDETEIDNQFKDIASINIGWVRFDISWADIQKTPDKIEWSQIDLIVKSAKKHNLKILPILSYTPVWARSRACASSEKCAPADFDLFTGYVAAVVERYAPQGVHAWEIWNEPNIKGFWLPKPSAADYTNLLKRAYVTIKAEDPSSIVISGGLAPAATENGNIAPTDFLEGIYKSEGGAYFDVLGLHPYSYPILPSTFKTWNAWSQISETKINIKSVMEEYGDSGKEIWLTEYGAATGGPGVTADVSNYHLTESPNHVTEELQTNSVLEAMYLVKESPSIGPLFIHTYRDYGASYTTNENFFGMIRSNGSRKPLYDAIKGFLAPVIEQSL